MANEMTSAAPDSVQCPVCFKDFTDATINGHLDVCLLNSVPESGPSTADETGPPVKKSRISAESSVNKPVASSSSSSSSAPSMTQSSTTFSLFQTNKSKASAQGERSGLFTSKQSPVRAVNKGTKRLLNETEPREQKTTESLSSQTSVSSAQPAAKSNYVSPQALLSTNKPLAEILRPQTLEDYFGQSKVVGEQTLLRSLLESQEIPSLILWGPPGCGKVWS